MFDDRTGFRSCRLVLHFPKEVVAWVEQDRIWLAIHLERDLLLSTAQRYLLRRHPVGHKNANLGRDGVHGNTTIVLLELLDVFGFRQGSLPSAFINVLEITIRAVVREVPGAGLGLRYDTGFGPIRFDVATPVAGDTGDGVQIYIGIGQAF